MRRWAAVSAGLLVGLAWWAAHADEAGEAPGLAATYPGDRGIERDPAVLFHEDFEGGDLSRWSDQDGNRPPEVTLAHEPAKVHAGQGAAELWVRAGKGGGADLTKWLDRGYRQLYARYYLKYPADYDQGNLHHCGGWLNACRDRNQLGVSGTKPDGTDRFSTGLEPWRDWGRNPAPGELMLYTYWPDMKPDPSGPYYGNAFKPAAEAKVLMPRDQWVCCELMVRCNTVDAAHPAGAADGEQAFWIDGQLKGRYTGLRWRSNDSLQLNCFWLMVYLHDSPQANRLWADDIVVATRPIGPRLAP